MTIRRPEGRDARAQNGDRRSAKRRKKPDTGNFSALVITDHHKLEPRIDSRVLAEHLSVRHKAVTQLLDRYVDNFKRFGQLPFQKEVGARVQGGGNPERFALLNEDQTFFLLSLSRNTERVVELKARLVQAFREARQTRDLTAREYLPTYRLLHDEIAALAAGSSNERFVHMNMNRLLNATVGCAPGGRGNLPLPAKAMLVTAQVVATNAMQGALDHRDGYRRAKDALDQLGALAVSAPMRPTLANGNGEFIRSSLAGCLALLVPLLLLIDLLSLGAS